MTKLSLKSLSIALAAAAFLPNTAALAGNLIPDAPEEVAFHPDELTTAYGVDRIHKEIVRAAENVCGADEINRVTLRQKRAQQNCVVETLDDFFASTDHAVLTAYNDALGDADRYTDAHGIVSDFELKEFRMADADEGRILR